MSNKNNIINFCTNCFNHTSSYQTKAKTLENKIDLIKKMSNTSLGEDAVKIQLHTLGLMKI